MKKENKINLQLFAVPTSDDIYIRIIHNGVSRKVAVIQSYKTNKNKEVKEVEAFGEKEAVETYGAKTSYDLELTRAYLLGDAYDDGIFLDELEDFDIVIEKPDRSETYSKCNWSKISEDGVLKDKVTENMSVKAAKFRRTMK